MPLHAHQLEHVERLLGSLQAHGSALDGSDTGCGKTWCAVGIAGRLNVPTLAVVPKIVVSSWRDVGAQMGVDFDVCHYERLRIGETPYGRWDNPPPKVRTKRLVCTSCQLEFHPDKPEKCPHHHMGIHCVEAKSSEHDYGKFRWYPGIRLIIFDEIHRCAALTKSLQAEMLIAARRQNIQVLGLSATVADSPLSLRAIGYALGLHGLIDRPGVPGFYRWALGYHCRRTVDRGFQFCGNEQTRQETMHDLHGVIFPEHGARMKNTVPVQITAEYYDTPCEEDIDEAYDRAEEAANGQDPLGYQAEMQAIELFKVPLFIELARDLVSEGRHVGIFVNYRATVEELCKRLKMDCRIDGSQVGPAGDRRRQKNIHNFLTDSAPIIVATCAAGNVGINLHDIRGQFPRAGLCSVNPSSRIMKQVFGRFPRDGAKSASIYRCVLSGKKEKGMLRNLTQKFNQMDLLNDGDLSPITRDLTNFIPRGMIERNE